MAKESGVVELQLDLKEGRNVKTTLKNIQKEFTKLDKSTSGAAKGTRMGALNKSANATLKTVQRLQNAYDKLVNAPVRSKQKDLAKLTQQLSALETRKKLSQLPKEQGGIELTRGQKGALTRNINKTQAGIANTTAELEQLKTKEAVKAREETAKSTAEYKNLKFEVDAVYRSASNTAEAFTKLNNETASIDTDRVDKIGKVSKLSEQDVQKLSERLTALKARQKDLEASGVGLGNTEYDKNVSEIQRLTDVLKQYKESLTSSNQKHNIFKTTLKILGATAGGVVKAFSKFNNVLKNSGKSSEKFSTRFKKLSTFLTKYLFGFRTFFYLYRNLLGQFRESLKNLAAGSPEVNDNLSALSTSLYQLRDQFIAAFAPVINFVVPILTTLVQKLNESMMALSNFFATLMGSSKVLKATAIERDFSESVSDTGKSAKNSKKDLDKFTASVDELNVIDDSSSSGSSDGASSTYEEIEAEQSKLALLVGGLAMMMQEAWRKVDFTDVGKAIGNAIKNALSPSNIPWNTIKSAGVKLAISLGTFISGLFQTEGLGTTLGSTLAEIFNTAYTTVTTLSSTIDFGAIGKFLAESISGFLDTFDWSQLGILAYEKITFVLELVTGFLENFDWRNLFKRVIDAVSKIISAVDWTELTESLSETLGAVVGAVASFLAGLGEVLWGGIKEAWSNVVDWWNEVAYEDGEFTMQGLLDGIKSKLQDIGSWIKEHIFQPFIDGFKKAFGIASPSKEMITMGEYLIEGLKNGITNAFTKITTAIDEMKQKIIDAFEKIKQGIKSPINAILRFIETFANGIIKGVNRVIDGLNSLSIDVPDWVTKRWGIESFGFNISPISEITIPKLATGAVLPPNQPFLSVVGDQTHGTNIEAPLDTIKQAVAEVYTSGNQDILYALNTLIRAVEDKDLSVNLDSKRIESGTRKVAQRRGAQIAVGGIYNYA